MFLSCRARGRPFGMQFPTHSRPGKRANRKYHDQGSNTTYVAHCTNRDDATNQPVYYSFFASMSRRNIRCVGAHLQEAAQGSQVDTPSCSFLYKGRLSVNGPATDVAQVRCAERASLRGLVGPPHLVRGNILRRSVVRALGRLRCTQQRVDLALIKSTHKRTCAREEIRGGGVPKSLEKANFSGPSLANEKVALAEFLQARTETLGW